MKLNRLILILILAASCNNPKPIESFTINGTIKGDIPAYIFLEYGNVKDSAQVESGKFQFKGFVEKPMEAYFSIPPISSMTDDFFYIENNNIQLDINIKKRIIKSFNINLITIDSIKGSEIELIRSDFKKFENTHENDVDWNSKLFQKLNSIITKNSNNNYSGNLLYNELERKILSKKQITYLYKKIDTNLLSNKQLESIHRFIDPEKIVKVGKQLIDFELINPKNELINTQSFRGKILLIDFWASWCVPCRKQNPALLQVYHKFKEKGFEIVGVSLDTDEDKWKNAIIKDGINWVNVIDTNGFSSKVAAKYNVTAIPTNYLIDKNGKIIAKDISVKDMEKQLNSLLK